MCIDDPNPTWKNEVVWYAGEEVCKQTTITKLQKRQTNINHVLGRGQDMKKHKVRLDYGYTAEELLRM